MELSIESSISFNGLVHGSKDLSGVAVMGSYLITASDEGHVVQILKKQSDTEYSVLYRYSLLDGSLLSNHLNKEPELDIEAIAVEGETVYAIGSHSAKRKKVLPSNPENRSYADNIKRLNTTSEEKTRRVVYKFTLGDDGAINSKIESISLWKAINKFPLLQPFSAIPSKENGIDIEGLASSEGKLFVGFRGPVLRENWVPVIVTEFNKPTKHAELRFVNLGGLGIRDLVAISPDYFLILAGPVGDGPGDYKLYSWNGRDCIPDSNNTLGQVNDLGTIPTKSGNKAEGLAVLPSTEEDYLNLLVVFDSAHNGGTATMTLNKNNITISC